MIRLDPLIYLTIPVMLLTLPLDWFLSALIAAILHELCHLIAIYALNAKVYTIRIGIGGAVIDAAFQSRFQELLCTLAGPAGSLLLLFLCRTFPKIAICAAIQGIFNLLPIYPLDGGRAVQCCLDLLCPKWTCTIGKGIEIGAVLLVTATAAAAMFTGGFEIMPLLVALALIIKVFFRKSPCKQGKNRVQ